MNQSHIILDFVELQELDMKSKAIEIEMILNNFQEPNILEINFATENLLHLLYRN